MSFAISDDCKSKKACEYERKICVHPCKSVVQILFFVTALSGTYSDHHVSSQNLLQPLKMPVSHSRAASACGRRCAACVQIPAQELESRPACHRRCHL